MFTLLLSQWRLCWKLEQFGSVQIYMCSPFQGEYFMVQDVYSKADVLNTTGSYGAPNFRQVKGSYPLYGMGQPSLTGFKQVLQRLQAQGQEVTAITCAQFHCAPLKPSIGFSVDPIFLCWCQFSSAWPLLLRVVSKYLRSQVLGGGCGWIAELSKQKVVVMCASGKWIFLLRAARNRPQLKWNWQNYTSGF